MIQSVWVKIKNMTENLIRMAQYLQIIILMKSRIHA